ncbi:RidA family protein [Nonomuraea lactucae]|uniref:RidA family protein n=1 Tax=Nonomuraea lactucae TaxID=2249762 RepID=UPI000DE44127|nr:RidA family protein [Nonomuraea lactucae]
MHVPVRSNTAKGPYSVALEANGLIFISGQGGLDPRTGAKVDGGIREETRQTLENIDGLLTEAGLSRSDLASVTCYLTDIDDWPAMNEVYAAFFEGVRPPTRTAVEVSRLPFGLSLEMTAIAVRSS